MHEGLFKPVSAESLKEVVVEQLEEHILSGKIAIGDKLPPERELAQLLGVGRPLVHEALIELAARDLVSVIPRTGTVVNDYRRRGSLAVLDSLVRYRQGELEPHLEESFFGVRVFFEVECARLAALNRTKDQLADLKAIVENETAVPLSDVDSVVELDFNFHLSIAIASQNMLYPLLINSFKRVYTHYTSMFFSDGKMAPEVFRGHRALVDAVVSSDSLLASRLMKELLEQGALIMNKHN